MDIKGTVTNSMNVSNHLSEFGMGSGQFKQLDRLDGEMDNKYFGTSLFEIASNIKVSYDKEVQENGLADSFYSYMKAKMETQPNPENMITEDSSFIPEYITGNLADILTEKNVVIKSKINSENVLSLVENYSKAYGIKSCFNGNNLVKDLILSNLSDEVKKKCLTLIKDAFDERISGLTGDTSYTSKAFKEAMADAVAGKNADKLLKLTDRYVKITKQLEAMQTKNKSITYDPNSYMHGIKHIPARVIEMGTNDYYGNGKFDNLAKQQTGNCYAHGYINNMLNTDFGREYINNLIVKTGDIISVYLPGAAEKNLPAPSGDGIYTYTPRDIDMRSYRESVGDGDFTAFMLAVTDYRRELTGKKNVSSRGGNPQIFNELIFGKEYSENSSNSVMINNPVDKQHLNMGDFDEYAKGKMEEIKEYFNNERGYLNVDFDRYIKGSNITNTEVYSKKSGDEKPVKSYLNVPHAYSIKEINDDRVVLSDSNCPEYAYIMTPSQFVKVFTVTYNEKPTNY